MPKARLDFCVEDRCFESLSVVWERAETDEDLREDAEKMKMLRAYIEE